MDGHPGFPAHCRRAPSGGVLAVVGRPCAVADDVARVDDHVDIYHADVAGHFSPAMLLFPDLISQIRPLTEKPIHVHLMIADSALVDQIDQFAEAGATLFPFMPRMPTSGRPGQDRRKGIAAGLCCLHTP